MTLFAAYMNHHENSETPENHLDSRIVSDAKSAIIMADAVDVTGFAVFLSRCKKCSR